MGCEMDVLEVAQDMPGHVGRLLSTKLDGHLRDLAKLRDIERLLAFEYWNIRPFSLDFARTIRPYCGFGGPKGRISLFEG